jgi:ParB-like chromosome segregation protein Spo0J
MRVIDGMHRLRAVALRGQDKINVQFYDGDEQDAFVLAVRANITHGLPLSLADRSAAAARIVRARPQWSDRMIAAAAGLSPKTVGAIRQRSTEEIPQLNKRAGGDGRARPVNSAEGRKIAGELIVSNPRATLRAIAEAAGISPATVRDVRERLRRGERPELLKRPGSKPRDNDGGNDTIASRSSGTVRTSILPSLRKDPSLRFNEAGRALLRLLEANTIEPDEWGRLIESIPTHCASMIADVAEECAETWRRVATQVKRRGSISA